MASLGSHAPVAAAFRHLVTATKIEAALSRIHSHDDLIKYFESLPWDEKVFSVADDHGLRWAVEVHKDGPTMTLTPTRPDVVESVAEISHSAFWNQFAEVIEEAHPNHHLKRPETFLERLFHDRVDPSRLKDLAVARHDDEAVREHRLKMRERQRDRHQQWRETKADENRFMYWLWYQ